MREIVHIQAGQCGNQIGTKVSPEGSRGRPLAAEPLSALADAPGRLLWAVSSRGAGLCQPAPPTALPCPGASRCREVPGALGPRGTAYFVSPCDHKRLWEVPKPNGTFSLFIFFNYFLNYFYV